MKPDLDELARMVVAESCTGSSAAAHDRSFKAARNALRSTWNAALEEAAGVALRANVGGTSSDRRKIADKIRALKVPHG